MKLRLSSFVLLALALFLGCNKQAEKDVSPLAPKVDQAVLTTTTVNWLNRAIVGKNGQPSPRITELKENLVMEKLTFARFSDKTVLIVIPMKSSFQVFNNADSLRVTNFTLKLDASGKVSDAQVVQYLSTQSNLDKLDAANLASVLEFKRSKLDGSFVVLAPNGRYEYDLRFSGGKLNRERVMQKEVSKNQSARTQDTCYDFYLVIYLEDDNGNWLLIIDYLGSLCDDDCGVPGPGGTASLCDEFTDPGGGGTGGGGGGTGSGGGTAANCSGQVTNYQNAVNNSWPDSGVPTFDYANDNGVTRDVTVHWKCFAGAGGGWWVESTEYATQTWSVPNNRWEWTTMTHAGITQMGTLPGGVSVFVTDGGLATIRPFSARMNLTLNVTYFFVNNCPNTPINANVNPVAKTFTSGANFPN